MREKLWYIPHVLVALLFCVACGVWWFVITKEGRGVLRVSFLDVGQGDAIFIETPRGKQVLIDGGKGKAVLRELGSVMDFGDRTIEVLIATHPDADHIGGLPPVLAGYKVGMVFESGVHDAGADASAFAQAIEKAGHTAIPVRQGRYLVLEKGVVLSFLFPDRDASNFEPNMGSVVARLTYGSTSFLFTGDAPVAIETYLVSRYGKHLASDVLKLGHHGSKTSSSALFLGTVDPRYAVVSAGCENPYGHPSPETIASLDNFGITHVGTCEERTIVFESDGKKVERK